MLFQNLNMPDKPGIYDISTDNDLIQSIAAAGELNNNPGDFRLEFKDAMAFPGLINSHDHLDFNLFPQFDNGKFNNYRDWAHDLHENFKAEIQQVMRVPQTLRTSWGTYKNLINGFTTVVNHGDPLLISSSPIKIIQEYNVIHSVGFEKNWIWKLNNPLAGKHPFIVHVGEGTDNRAVEEINQLIRWNLLKRKLVGVHGVAMTGNQAAKFKALIWCPESNFFMFGMTADIPTIIQRTRILFGTDSTLTAGWNAWEHFRRARLISKVSDKELFDMLTIHGADCWNRQQTGRLEANMKADMVIARINGSPSWNSFYAIDPDDILLVLQQGEIRLFDQELEAALRAQFEISPDSFSKIRIGNSEKFVEGNLPGLMDKIRTHYPKFESEWK
jgi:cytosine/adenosine deaminase-related metal-dependent hydrolase